MKITLSKSQWQFIGKKAGWMKKAQGKNSDIQQFTHVFNNYDKTEYTVQYSLNGYERAISIIGDRKTNLLDNEGVDIMMKEAGVKFFKNGIDVTKDEEGNWNDEVMALLSHLDKDAERNIRDAKGDAEIDDYYGDMGGEMTTEEASNEANYMELKDRRPMEAKIKNIKTIIAKK